MKNIKFSIAVEGDKDLHTYFSILEEAEKYEFYSLQIYEHIPFKPSLVIVSYLASKIRKIKIGPVTIPFFLNDPLILARNIAYLQEITNNNTLVGISRGAYSSYLCSSTNRSLEKFLDYMNCLSSIFEGMEYKGKYYNFKLSNKLSWISKDTPEIFVGTSGPKLCYEASKLKIVKGIVVDNLWNPEYAKKMLEIINKAVAESNKKEKVDIIARPFVFIDKDYERAKKKMEAILNFYLPELVGKSPMIDFASNEKIDIEKLACIGPIKKIEREIETMIKVGVNHICFGHPLGENIIKSVRIIGEEIVSIYHD